MDLSSKNRIKRFDLISISSSSIKVTWALDCPALSYFIQKYQIQFCRADRPCSETLTIIDVEKKAVAVEIDDLTPGTTYNFTLHALTDTGQEIESPMRTFETKIDSTSLIFTILIIIAGVITILLVVYSLFVCSMRKRKDQKELKKAVDSNWIPKMPSRLKGDANILLNPLCRETRNEYENKEYMNADSTNTTKFIGNGLNTKLKMDEAIANNGKNVIILSTISDNQLHDVINIRSSSSLPSTSSLPSSSSSSSSSSTPMSLGSVDPDERFDSSNYKKIDGTNVKNITAKKERKSSDGCGCDSEDSGYSARLSDKHPYYRAASFNISGIIRSINEDSPYIVPDIPSGIPLEKISNNASPVARSLSDSDLSYNGYTVITIDSPSKQSNGYLSDLHRDHGNDDQKDIQIVSNGYVYG
uniref:Fibronectin type-III domain-containing protein n=1 Tax=Tetranychus urticae TaxID=32264 RepID=T1K4K2_TETUR